MSDNLKELLKLASNDSGDTSNDKPPGVQVGDILSNGWASNRNPLKLFMYLGMGKDSFRGINIEGKSAGPVRRSNAVKIVLPRDTPDYWHTPRAAEGVRIASRRVEPEREDRGVRRVGRECSSRSTGRARSAERRNQDEHWSHCASRSRCDAEECK